MIRREYLVGLTWERAGELVAEGWEVVGATTHSDGVVVVTVYREIRDADAEPGAEGDR